MRLFLSVVSVITIPFALALGLVYSGLGQVPAQTPTKILKTQVKESIINQAAKYVNVVYILTPTQNIDTFNLVEPPTTPTLATVWVYADGRLLSEDEDYTVAPDLKSVKTKKTYSGITVQIRYLGVL